MRNTSRSSNQEVDARFSRDCKNANLKKKQIKIERGDHPFCADNQSAPTQRFPRRTLTSEHLDCHHFWLKPFLLKPPVAFAQCGSEVLFVCFCETTERHASWLMEVCTGFGWLGADCSRSEAQVGQVAQSWPAGSSWKNPSAVSQPLEIPPALGEGNPLAKPLVEALRIARSKAKVLPLEEQIIACKHFVEQARKRVSRVEAVISRALEQKVVFEKKVQDGEARLQQLEESQRNPDAPGTQPRQSQSCNAESTI